MKKHTDSLFVKNACLYVFSLLFIFSFISLGSATITNIYAQTTPLPYQISAMYDESGSLEGYGSLDYVGTLYIGTHGKSAGADLDRAVLNFDVSSIPNNAIINSVYYYWKPYTIYDEDCTDVSMSIHENDYNPASWSNIGSQSEYVSTSMDSSDEGDLLSIKLFNNADGDLVSDMNGDDIFSLGFVGSENKYAGDNEDCRFRIKQDIFNPYIAVDWTPSPYVNFVGSLPVIALNYTNTTTIDIDNYVSSNYQSSYDDNTIVTFDNPVGSGIIVLYDGDSYSSSYFDISLINNLITINAKTLSVNNYEFQVDISHDFGSDDGAWFYLFIGDSVDYTDSAQLGRELPDITLDSDSHSTEYLDLNQYFEDVYTPFHANYSDRYYFVVDSVVYEIGDLYQHYVYVDGTSRLVFEASILTSGSMYFEFHSYITTIKPIYVYACNQIGCTNDLMRVFVQGSNNDYSDVPAVSPKLTEFFSNRLGGIYPDVDSLTSKQSWTYILTTMALLAVLFFVGVFFTKSSLSSALVYLLLFLEACLFIFFVSIGYIGLKWVVMLSLFMLVLIFFKVKTGA